MAFLNDGDSIFSKYPSDIQVRLKGRGQWVWVPFTGLTYDITKEMTAEHYSGDGRPVNITEGNVDYKGTLETGWVVNGLPAEWEAQGVTELDAEGWEYLLYTYLINPSNQGRSVPFRIEYHEREYDAASGRVVGGAIWAMFEGCKLNHHSFSSAQGSLAKRSYEWMAKRVTWGTTVTEA